MQAGSSRDDFRVFRTAGAIAFAASLAYFAWRYATAFGSPLHSSGVAAPVIINATVFAIFAVHHSVFARAGVRALVASRLPEGLERSLYVWTASVLFAAMAALWQPVPGLLWQAAGPLRWLLMLCPVGALILVLAASRHFSARALAGLPTAARAPESEASAPGVRLSDRGPYGVVRHPLYVAVLLTVWSTPTMTGTRLCFAVLTTLYVLIAIPFEERDLRRAWGPAYDTYSRGVRARLLPFVY